MWFKEKQPEIAVRIGYRTILRDVEKLLIHKEVKQKEMCYNGCIHFPEEVITMDFQ